jgi:MerR family transcriptional regulator/heat shock protein HspR
MDAEHTQRYGAGRSEDRGAGHPGRVDADHPEHRQFVQGYGVPPDRPIRQVLPDGRIVGEIRSDTPVFVISVAAELAGMHAQTLRSYDREGLVSPGRTAGGGRRYSQRDISTLREVQRLSQEEGVNRAGIRRIIELEAEADALREKLADLLEEVSRLRADLAVARANAARTEMTGLTGELVPWRASTTAIVSWRPRRR